MLILIFLITLFLLLPTPPARHGLTGDPTTDVSSPEKIREK